MIYTQEDIDKLIDCPKRVTNSPKDSGVGRGSSKIKFSLESIDGMNSFSGFISRNLNRRVNIIDVDRQKHFPPPNHQIDINFDAPGFE